MMDATKQPGFEVIAKSPPGETFRSMVEFQGRLLVATDAAVYELIGDRLVKLRFERAQAAA